jgi:hypothetical protein
MDKKWSTMGGLSSRIKDGSLNIRLVQGLTSPSARDHSRAAQRSKKSRSAVTSGKCAAVMGAGSGGGRAHTNDVGGCDTLGDVGVNNGHGGPNGSAGAGTAGDREFCRDLALSNGSRSGSVTRQEGQPGVETGKSCGFGQ